MDEVQGTADSGADRKVVAEEVTEPQHPCYLPHWGGDDPETLPSAEAILASQVPLRHSEDKLLAFFHGDQWPAEVRDERMSLGRPALVVNRLPTLVSIALSRSRDRSIELEKYQLIFQITERNWDAQMAYNYMYSSAVELTALALQKAREEAKETPITPEQPKP